MLSGAQLGSLKAGAGIIEMRLHRPGLVVGVALLAGDFAGAVGILRSLNLRDL